MKGAIYYIVFVLFVFPIDVVNAWSNWAILTKHRATDAATVVQAYQDQTKSYSTHKSLQIVSKCAIIVAALAYNVPLVHAETLVPESATKAIENVERVMFSLKYIQDDIARTSDASPIVSQIKFLLTNYKLRENVDKSIPVVSKKLQEDARAHGRTAYEDLATVYEYFEDEIDDTTGKKKPSPEVLQFADVAVQAARKELKELIALYPQDVVSEIETKLKPDFTSSVDVK